jgi:hypothetical protein
MAHAIDPRGAEIARSYYTTDNSYASMRIITAILLTDSQSTLSQSYRAPDWKE